MDVSEVVYKTIIGKFGIGGAINSCQGWHGIRDSTEIKSCWVTGWFTVGSVLGYRYFYSVNCSVLRDILLYILREQRGQSGVTNYVASSPRVKEKANNYYESR